MKLPERRSIVGCDPTSEGIAFVFFERGELLDWGTRVRNGEGDELAILDALLNGCAADVLVLEDPEAAGSRRKPRIASLLAAMARHARARRLTVRLVSRHDVRAWWRERGFTNKEAAAEVMARWFSELRPLVPRRRTAAMNESRRVNVFDALSLVLHALGPGTADLDR